MSSFLTLAVCFATSGAGPVEMDWAREQDPPLEQWESVAKFSARLKLLWLEALARPEADLKRQAAEAIVRAHALGMPGLEEVVPHLRQQLEVPNAHPVVCQAAARALIALDARATAPVLMKYVQEAGLDAAELVESALWRWDYAPMRPVWLARLADPQVPRGLLILAARGAAAVNLSEAVPHLRRLALDPQEAGDVRLEAARSLAVLQPAGLEDSARSLAADLAPPRVFDRLIAATLLSRHRGPPAEALLRRLVDDRSPAVAAIAVRRLLEIDPLQIEPFLDRLVSSPDAGLRQLAAQALSALRTPEAVAILASLLDDPHRDLRVNVREFMIKLAGVAPLQEPVRQATMRTLESSGPRGLEQAVMIVGAIRHEPAAERLLQLLDDANAEVNVAAAWALRRLAVAATGGPIVHRVQGSLDTLEKRQSRNAPAPGSLVQAARTLSFDQMGHLIEALGKMRFLPAAPLLRKFLPVPPPPVVFPRSPYWHPDLRAAALWSLGHICAGDPPADLTTLFRVRLISAKEPDQEDTTMRALMAINLGRMKSQDAVPTLQRYHQSENSAFLLRVACAWALGNITGKPLPKLRLKPREIWHQGWFLEPAEAKRRVVAP